MTEKWVRIKEILEGRVKVDLPMLVRYSTTALGSFKMGDSPAEEQYLKHEEYALITDIVKIRPFRWNLPVVLPNGKFINQNTFPAAVDYNLEVLIK